MVKSIERILPSGHLGPWDRSDISDILPDELPPVIKSSRHKGLGHKLFRVLAYRYAVVLGTGLLPRLHLLADGHRQTHLLSRPLFRAAGGHHCPRRRTLPTQEHAGQRQSTCAYGTVDRHGQLPHRRGSNRGCSTQPSSNSSRNRWSDVPVVTLNAAGPVDVDAGELIQPGVDELVTRVDAGHAARRGVTRSHRGCRRPDRQTRPRPSRRGVSGRHHRGARGPPTGQHCYKERKFCNERGQGLPT